MFWKFELILDLYNSIISVLVGSDLSSLIKTLVMSGVAVASWKITENIDNGSKFNSLE